MPEAAERALKAKARKMGLKPGSKRWRRYVYGGLRSTGWKPSRERSALPLVGRHK